MGSVVSFGESFEKSYLYMGIIHRRGGDGKGNSVIQSQSSDLTWSISDDRLLLCSSFNLLWLQA